MKKENDSDWNDWVDLCGYVKKDILGYSDDMKIPKFIILRLRGLAKGQFIANKKIKPMAKYDYKTILYTFKACKFDILNGLRGNNTKFKDEAHKFNYCMVIVENNINDMVIRLQNSKKAVKKAKSLDMDKIAHKSATYKTKTKKTNKNLDELW